MRRPDWLHVLGSAWGGGSRQPRPGQVLAVTVDSDVTCASLWVLGAPWDHGSAVPLSRAADREAEQARRLAIRALPLLDTRRLRRATPPKAHLLCLCQLEPVQPSSPALVTGASLGLPLVLASASLLLDLPVPTDLVASAAVSVDGALHPVDALRGKARAVGGWALGVRRMLVYDDPDQLEAVRQGARDAGAPLQPIGVRSVRDALDLAFPDLEQAVRQRWRARPDEVPRIIESLFRTAFVGRSHLVSWRGIASAAEELAEVTDDPTLKHRARIAAAIASRHEGLEAPLSRQVNADLPEPLRLRYLAHWMQAAADRADPAHARAAVEDVEDALDGDARTWTEQHLVLGGATGRALAAAGRLERAAVLLDRVVHGWFALYREHEASHALCELLRIRGLLGDAAPLLDLESLAARVVDDPRTDDTSRGFLALALGRAHATLGQWERAVAALERDDLSWGLLPAHLGEARARWMARCQRALGRPVPSARPSGRQGWLWDLDAANHAGDAEHALALLDAPCTLDDPEARRTLAVVGRDPRAVADHYRY